MTARVPVNLLLTRDIGLNRRSIGKKPGFVESVQGLVEVFYRDVVQVIRPWTPPPAKLPERPAPPVEPSRDWSDLMRQLNRTDGGA